MNEKSQAILDSIPNKDEKIMEMAKLLLECRDALPAITMVAAKIRGMDLTLSDRIENSLEPWVDPDGV